MVSDILLLYVTFTVVQLPFILNTSLAAKMYNVGIETISINAGPKVLKYPVCGILCRIGIIPGTGFVKMNVDDFNALHHLRRTAIMLAGILGYFIVGMTISPLTIDKIALCFIQGTICPIDKGALYIGEFIKLSRCNWLGSVGVISLNLGIINSMPIPVCNGGQILHMYLIDSRCERVHNIVLWLGVGILISIYAIWLIAATFLLFLTK